MKFWMDFNRDGKVEWSERMLAEEMLCGSKKEFSGLHDEDDFDLDIEDELELMDEDERYEALEDAGLDPDDFDFDE